MLRKIATIKVPTGAGTREVKTKYVFASYDRQGAAFAFYFSDSIVAGTKANLLFMIDGQKVFVDDDVTLGETNETHTFTYPLPYELLNYTGKIDGYLYFDFEDGSHSDEIHFVFTIKKSKIDEEMEEAPDVYIKSFEDIKAEVQEAADGAIKDIGKVKNDAESQIGDYVGEVESAKESTIEDIDKALPEVVESAKQDISSSASDVQSKADQAKKDMQDNVDQVESDYQAWKEQQEKKQEDFEATTDEKVSNITERVGEAENKASDLERHLDVGQKNYFSVTSWEDNASTHVVDNYLPAIKIKLEGNTKYTLSTNIPMYDESSGKNSVFFATSDVGRVSSGIHGVTIDEPLTITTNDDGGVVIVIRDKDMTSGDWWVMLNKGETPARWVPNANDLVTKSELEKIKQAIINLGGSV